MASVITLIIEKNVQKKIISDLPTLIFSRYETGTTGFFLGLNEKKIASVEPLLLLTMIFVEFLAG